MVKINYVLRENLRPNSDLFASIPDDPLWVSTSDLLDLTSSSPSALSQRLKRLVNKGLVRVLVEGRKRYYQRVKVIPNAV